MDVVIKLIREDTVSSSKIAEGLLRHEARVLGSLRGIEVTLPLRQVSEGWSSYLAIPYVNGDPITTHCKTRGLGTKERLRLFARCVDRIARIHERGVVHGDLKSEHLLIDLDASSSPVVIDFGLATLSDRTSHAVSGEFNIGGTKDYMAPELTLESNELGCRPNPNQDVFSLGRVLERLMKDIEPGRVRQTIADIVLKATAPIPEDRYKNARAMHEAMAEILSVRPPSIHEEVNKEETPGAQGFNWRQPLLVSVLVGIVIVGAVAFSRMPNKIGGVADTESEKNEPEDPGQALSASFLTDLVARAEDEPEAVLDAIDQLSENDQVLWEVGHAQALAIGLGKDNPFGDLPYVEVHAPVYAYHAETNTLVWCDMLNQVYMRRDDAEVTRLWRSQVMPQQIEIHPDGTEVLIRDMAGAVNIVSIDKASFGEARELPRVEPMPHLVSYSQSGDAVMVWRSSIHMFETWDADDLSKKFLSRHLPGANFNQYLITNGCIGTCRTVETSKGDRTHLDLYDHNGEVVCKVVLPIPGDVTSIEFQSGFNLLCLGTTNGHLITFDLINDTHIITYLGFGTSVADVIAAPDENRVFVSLGRVHVISLENGEEILSLGGIDDPSLEIASLHWNPRNRSVVACNPLGIHRWRAEPRLD